MPGVVKVVIEDGFAGVVAKSRLEAWAARNALEVEWDEGYLLAAGRSWRSWSPSEAAAV